MVQLDKQEEEKSLSWWTILTIASYAVVLLLIGVPLWWKTTAVQRVPLPYNDMEGLSKKLESLQIKIHVHLIGFSPLSAADKANYQNLDGHSFNVLYNEASPIEMDTIYKSPDIYQIDKKMCRLQEAKQGEARPINIYYVGRADLFREHGEKIIFGNCRSFYYISNTSKIKSDLISSTFRRITLGVEDYGSLVDLKRPKESWEDLQLPLSSGYNLLLSLLVPEPEVVDSKWEIEAASKSYIDPMLEKLKSFAEFSVRSQVLYYVRLNLYPRLNAAKNYYEIPYEQLPLVINPVESRLTSFVSQNPVLNFLTYTSPCNKSPLQILERDGSPLPSNAFLVPQWGGIFVYNPPCPKNETEYSQIHQVSTEKVVSVLISQFRSLIGLPETTSQDILDFRSSALRDWEVDMIVRKRLRKLIQTAANTLQSLGQLLDEITNIVVTEEVGDQVEKSVDAIKSCIQQVGEGKLHSAQANAIQAFKSSEIAFHHPKNLKQLYFPDDQKYAIYIPLFLPIGIPVVMSLKEIFEHYFRKWRKLKSKTE